MKTICYFTNSGIYKGWNKLCAKNLYEEVRGWLSSGNTVRINGNTYKKGDFNKILYREL